MEHPAPSEHRQSINEVSVYKDKQKYFRVTQL